MHYSKLRRGWWAILFLFGVCVFPLGCEKPAEKTIKAELPSDDQLRDRLDQALEFTYTRRHLNTTDQAAWQIVHGALVFGRDFQIYHDGKLVSALEYLLAGGELRGWTFRKGDHGLTAIVEAGSKMGQGHPDQWLGYLSQSGLSPEGSIVVAGQTYKIQDLITQAQWDIYDGMEATWTLMAFSTYLPLDTEWTAKDGSKWNIQRIVRMEAEQDLAESACGGTHRMYGLTVAMNRYLAAGGKLSDNPDGTWEKAHKKIRDAVAACKEYQQPDGSFSTNYFSRPSTSADIAARISTTGHALEFLMVSLSDDELKEPWVTRAALHLVGCFEKTQRFDLECGALYHAAHGLDLYRARRFGARKLIPSIEPAKPAAEAAAAAGQ
ncbi:MAG: ADP-ribosylation factor-directed GTPase activating protein isoform b [Planctomycetia bacterium]|nr:ADP-ribosylation factor-directed GTPase activating protein isoform b [Planctomycetia bacterium]